MMPGPKPQGLDPKAPGGSGDAAPRPNFDARSQALSSRPLQSAAEALSTRDCKTRGESHLFFLFPIKKEGMGKGCKHIKWEHLQCFVLKLCMYDYLLCTVSLKH